MARYQSRRRIDQRQDRYLNHRIAADQRIEHAQFARMHDILGIVQHHRSRACAAMRLLPLQRAPQRVEAIGLGGGAIVRPRYYVANAPQTMAYAVA